MRELDAILDPSSSECGSQKLRWVVDGTASAFLGRDRRGERQLVSCGRGGNLGSLDLLFPRGNPGLPPPVAGATAPTSSPGGERVGEGSTRHNGSSSPALPPQPQEPRAHLPDEETVAGGGEIICLRS